MSTQISTTVDIAATPQAVWKVLTDFAAYREWNPFIDRAQGTPEVGTKLVLHMAPDGGRGITFKPTVLTATAGRELRWLGTLGVKGIFDGEHSFVLTPNSDGSTRVTQSERFSGVLVTVMKGTVNKSNAGFEAFNLALKQRVETGNTPQ